MKETQETNPAQPALVIETGKTYKLRHERFGRATVKILHQAGEWIDTEIVSGRLCGQLDDWEPGDKKTVRRCHCFFSPI